MRTNILSKVTIHAETFIFGNFRMSVSMPGLRTVRTLLKTGNTVWIIAGWWTGRTLSPCTLGSGVTMVRVGLAGQTHLQSLIIVTSEGHGADTVVLLRLGHLAASGQATGALTTLHNQSFHQQSFFELVLVQRCFIE